MYFDAVLDESMQPLFNGTPGEVKEWIKNNETDNSIRVCIGSSLTLVTVPEYLHSDVVDSQCDFYHDKNGNHL